MSCVSLSEDFIHRTIDNVIASEHSIMSPDGSPRHKNITLHRTASPSDWNSLLSSLSSDEEYGTHVLSLDFRTSFYFGIEVWSSETEQPGEKLLGFCTFYAAYSTWDGRMLYVDQINAETDGSLLLYRVMAKIATEIGSTRLTWKQKDRPEWNDSGIVNPEYLDDWILLSMDRLAMANFIGSPQIESSSELGTDEGEIRTMKSFLFLYVEDTIRETLEEQTISTNCATANLRLAGPEDTETIARLVHQLAIYEKEPDAVNMTAQDYFMDGYNSAEPLFYCILADVVATDRDGDGETEPTTTTTVAMGLFYFGHDLVNGPFLYLADLFCDEAFRGKGIGTEIMKQLASISLALDCSQFVWCALDWNAPALSFYNKIGATIKQELKITRYCGKDLQSFAQSQNK